MESKVVCSLLMWTSTAMICSSNCCNQYEDETCSDIDMMKGRYYSNRYIVHVDGEQTDARNIAAEMGFLYLEPMQEFAGHHYFRHADVPERHKMKHQMLTNKLKSHPKVKTADQQYVIYPGLHEIEDFTGMVGALNADEVDITDIDPSTIQLEEGYLDNLRNNDYGRFSKHPEPILPPLGTVWPEFQKRKKQLKENIAAKIEKNEKL